MGFLVLFPIIAISKIAEALLDGDSDAWALLIIGLLALGGWQAWEYWQASPALQDAVRIALLVIGGLVALAGLLWAVCHPVYAIVLLIYFATIGGVFYGLWWCASWLWSWVWQWL